MHEAGSSTDDYWNGLWGILRAYTGLRNDLEPLPDNPNGRSNIDPGAVGAYDFSCPKNAPVSLFDVSAVTASAALPNGRDFPRAPAAARPPPPSLTGPMNRG